MIGTILVMAACIGNGVLLIVKLRLMQRLAAIECAAQNCASKS